MMVREFRGKKYISSSKDYSKIEKIADIGDVEKKMMWKKLDQVDKNS